MRGPLLSIAALLLLQVQEQPGPRAIDLGQSLAIGEGVTLTISGADSRSRQAFGSAEKRALVIDLHFAAQNSAGLTLQPSSDPSNSDVTLEIDGKPFSPLALATYYPENTAKSEMGRIDAVGLPGAGAGKRFVFFVFTGKLVVSFLFEPPQGLSSGKRLRLGLSVNQRRQILLVDVDKVQ